MTLGSKILAFIGLTLLWLMIWLMLEPNTAWAGSAQSNSGHQIFSADDVFNLEYAADPQISPDGKTTVSYTHLTLPTKA